MFSKDAFRAFTVIELIISLVIMAMTTIFAMSVLFKTDKKSKQRVRERVNEVVCFNGSNSKELGQLTDKGGYCEFDISEYPEMISKEFIQIRLIGAGAKNGIKSSAGGERNVIYPSLQMPFQRTRDMNTDNICDSAMCNKCGEDRTCEECVKGYKLVNGECEINFVYLLYYGKYSGGNGGETIFAVQDNGGEGQLPETLILETAPGGTYSSEQECVCSEGGSDCDECNVDKSKETSSSHSSGYIDQDGSHDGEVRISW